MNKYSMSKPKVKDFCREAHTFTREAPPGNKALRSHYPARSEGSFPPRTPDTPLSHHSVLRQPPERIQGHASEGSL